MQRRLRALHGGYRDLRYRVEDGAHERGATPQVVHEDTLADGAAKQTEFETAAEPHHVAAELRKRVLALERELRMAQLAQRTGPAGSVGPPQSGARKLSPSSQMLDVDVERRLKEENLRLQNELDKLLGKVISSDLTEENSGSGQNIVH